MAEVDLTKPILIQCWECGELNREMVTKSAASNYYYYTCQHCGVACDVNIKNIEPIEDDSYLQTLNDDFFYFIKDEWAE